MYESYYYDILKFVILYEIVLISHLSFYSYFYKKNILFFFYFFLNLLIIGNHPWIVY
jgi:hypothetical protein